MIRFLVVGLAILSFAGAETAQAQQMTRRAVAAGEVTGLEMSIEGTLHGVPGGELVWMVTVYEVVRRRDLRPAANVALRATAAFAPETPIATARTDAEGRAVLRMMLPAEIASGTVMVEAVSPRNVRRTFDTEITLEPRQQIELWADRERAPPGGTVLVFGRVRDGRDGRVRAGVEVRVEQIAGGAPVHAPRMLQTDARGVFAAVLELPDRETPVGVAATTTEGGHASTNIAVERTHSDPIWVRVRPERRLVAPGDVLAVEVEVRDASGVPVPGARLEWTDAPPEREARPIRTDARGIARLAWEIDRRSVSGGFADLAREIRVVHAAHGIAPAIAQVRVARRPFFVTWSVEGGGLVPGLPARVFARVTEPDGTTRAGRSVSLEATRLRPATPSTPGTVRSDADGIAVFDLVLDPAAANDPATEACGGPTATGATLIVDGVREELCLPIDPDATLAVRAAPGSAAGTLDVRIRRRADVARNVVLVTALVRAGESWLPVARATIGASEAAASLPIGERAPGEVWVRARTVVAGGQEVRGGGTLVWVGTAPPRPAWEVGSEGANASPLDAAATQAVVAVDPERARGIEAAIENALGPIGAAVGRGRGPAFVEALAASRVPVDAAASAVLRDGRVEAMALPDDAVALGLLRDPWRTRARFVRGRLGAMMRAVETYVDARVPDQLAEVAVRDARGWRFNREVLEAALEEAGLVNERAAALDGEPLDIDALTALDPAFTYDRVATRITRLRLFRMLGFLRQLVRQRDLDLPWARRGDPGQYPIILVEAELDWPDEVPERGHLFDAWGQPFQLVPVRGRARFEFLQPVSGYELISAGPDGRIRTGDDVADPFARILPSGSVYSEAVGEDALIARVGSVALGRATIESLAEAFEVQPGMWSEEEAPVASASWEGAPAPFETLARPPAPVPLLADVTGEVRAAGTPAAARVTWRLPRERRPYVAVALLFGSDGSLGWSTHAFEAGSPVAARFEPPEVMRPGERLVVPLTTVRLDPRAPEPRLVVGGRGAVDARVEGAAVVLEARRAGTATIEIRLDSEGGVAWTASHRVRVLPPGSLRATHAGAVAAPDAELVARLPEGARPWRGHVVIGTPQSVRRDPLFATDALERAAISAWADVVGGGTADPEHLAGLLRPPPADAVALSTACSLVVWAAQPQPSPYRGTAAERLPEQLPADLGSRAAVLAALAPAAPSVVDEHASDPVAAVIATLRQDGWRTLATERDQPTVMARMAAALLLADRRDSIGRALFERARAAAGRDGFGEEVISSYAGTVALAIAARQIGDDRLADRLVPAILRRLHLARRLGTETTFWVLAASAYGALGTASVEQVEVEIDGASRRVALEDGIAVVPVTPGDAVRVRAPRGARVWTRVESRTVRTVTRRDDLPIVPSFEGDLGRAGERAALELVVESRSDDEANGVVVEVSLPSGAVLDDMARTAMRSASSVTAVEGPDRAGVVRVYLTTLRGRGTHRVPFPIRWLASGRRRGLELVLYQTEYPWSQTVRPARVVDIPEAR